MLNANTLKKVWPQTQFRSQEGRAQTLERQKTIRRPVTCQGIGVHSGQQITMTLKPASIGTGIVFIRTDQSKLYDPIPARWDYVVDTMLCTKIGNNQGVTVSTIEHIMAALYACEIDNLTIELDGPEVPIMDGSAEPFVDLIEAAGISEQKALRGFIKVLKTITVKRGKSMVSLSPAGTFSVSCQFSFNERAKLAAQFYEFDGSPASFKRDIIRARTFGFRQEVEHLWSLGLAKGGSLENAVVIDQDQILNPEGFRYPDECVRHKVLDALGDLYLAGAPIEGHFKGVQCGHHMQSMLLNALFADPLAWCFVVPEREDLHSWPLISPVMTTGTAVVA
ncbi:MAG: UDP-3-O-acyl-N-acetylglucosamine deacetylase [Alphaproteobacteria bacterium]|nr:UDP-3-O-acyl-N-acetylglucosamine deacetylase [Alphaproteobacteria bacterium]